jgi:hypothetical protein
MDRRPTVIDKLREEHSGYFSAFAMIVDINSYESMQGGTLVAQFTRDVLSKQWRLTVGTLLESWGMQFWRFSLTPSRLPWPALQLPKTSTINANTSLMSRAPIQTLGILRQGVLASRSASSTER